MANNNQDVLSITFAGTLSGANETSLNGAVAAHAATKPGKILAQIATASQRFDADITLEKDGLVVNARDLLDVLALDCPQGTRLVLRTRGPQAREAAASITSLFARKFEEI